MSYKSMYQKVIDNSFAQSDYSLYQIALIDGINNPAARIKTFNSLVERYPQSDLAAESYLQIVKSTLLPSSEDNEERYVHVRQEFEKFMTNETKLYRPYSGFL